MRPLLVLTLVLVAAVPALLVAWRSGYGIMFTPDGATYAGVAQNLLDGHGLTSPLAQLVDSIPPSDAAEQFGRTPLVRWPPGYPLAIAGVAAVTGQDAVDGARALAVVLAATNGLLIWFLARRWTGSRLAGVCCALVVSVESAWLFLHTFVLSEPLYVAAELASLAAAWMWVRSQRTAFLVLAAVAAGGAWLTRFTGVAVAGALVVLVLVCSTRRVRDVAIVAAAAVPAVAWTLWLELSPYAEEHRVVRSLEPGEHERLANNVAGWFADIEIGATSVTAPGTGGLRWGIFAVVVVLCGVGLWRLGRYAVMPALTIAGTLAVVLVTAIWVRQIPVAGRMFLPLQPIVVCLAATGLWHGIGALARRYGDRHPLTLAATGAAVVVAAASVVAHADRANTGPVPPPVPDPALAAWMDAVPRDVIVFTNDPAAVYPAFFRPAVALPSATWQESNEPNEDYEAWLAEVVEMVQDGRAVAVLYPSSAYFNRGLPDGGELAAAGLEVRELGDVTVVEAGPGEGATTEEGTDG